MLGAIAIGDAEHWLVAYPHELSGGMAQRVCLAIALAAANHRRRADGWP
jgi:peptide/nickel transport system permease protein